MIPSPTQIEPYSPTEILLAWNTGEHYTVPYVEIRYYCPCAGCVDEHTGQRTIQKESISPEIRPVDVKLIGRYAVQITWSDRHDTGMYHYKRLWELCKKQGRKIEKK
jgi:DUF971 family protein